MFPTMMERFRHIHQKRMSPPASRLGDVQLLPSARLGQPTLPKHDFGYGGICIFMEGASVERRWVHRSGFRTERASNARRAWQCRGDAGC